MARRTNLLPGNTTFSRSKSIYDSGYNPATLSSSGSTRSSLRSTRSSTRATRNSNDTIRSNESDITFTDRRPESAPQLPLISRVASFENDLFDTIAEKDEEEEGEETANINPSVATELPTVERRAEIVNPPSPTHSLHATISDQPFYSSPILDNEPVFVVQDGKLYCNGSYIYDMVPSNKRFSFDGMPGEEVLASQFYLA